MTSTVIPIRQAGDTVAPSTNRPGRILLLSTNLGVGGGDEEQVHQLALELKSRAWTVGIISMLRPDCLPAELEGSGINIGTLDMNRGVADLRKVTQLAQIIRRFRPDVVHSHMAHANILARVARPMADVPALVCTLHGSSMFSVKSGSTRLRELAHRFTDRWADVTTATCHAAADSCLRDGAVRAEKIMVVPNGVDTDRYLPRPHVRERMRAALNLEGRFVWLAAGCFEPEKNYALMIHAFSLAHETRHRDAVLLVCGAGSMYPQIEAKVRRLGLEQFVRFLGVRPDMPDVMNAADAFLLSSDTEGLCMALLQASSSGLPVVATAVGGNAEIVQQNRTGFLVPRGDATALAGAIERLGCLNRFDRARLGRAGRQFVHENFGIGRVVDIWEQLYRCLLASRPSRSVRS